MSSHKSTFLTELTGACIYTKSDSYK